MKSRWAVTFERPNGVPVTVTGVAEDAGAAIERARHVALETLGSLMGSEPLVEKLEDRGP